MEISRSYDRLISTIEFPRLVRWHLYIESGPWHLNQTMSSFHVMAFSLKQFGIIPHKLYLYHRHPSMIPLYKTDLTQASSSWQIVVPVRYVELTNVCPVSQSASLNKSVAWQPFLEYYPGTLLSLCIWSSATRIWYPQMKSTCTALQLAFSGLNYWYGTRIVV